MGNRAVITDTSKQIGVYLHWNGGYDSVSAFCEYARLKNIPAPSDDCDYAWARFCQIVGNFFGGTGSLGVGLYKHMDKDNGDNGVYIVGADWKIVKREYMRGAEQRNHDLAEMLEGIDAAQPAKERLGKAFLTAEVVPVSALEIGDEVAFVDYDGESHTAQVVGYGTRDYVNGVKARGVPYLDKYGKGRTDAERNPNNYLTGETARRVIKTEANDGTPETPPDPDKTTAK